MADSLADAVTEGHAFTSVPFSLFKKKVYDFMLRKGYPFSPHRLRTET